MLNKLRHSCFYHFLLILFVVILNPCLGQRTNSSLSILEGELSNESILNKKLKISGCPENVPIVDRDLIELNKEVNSTYPIYIVSPFFEVYHKRFKYKGRTINTPTIMFESENEIRDYFVDNDWVESSIDVEYLIEDSARFKREVSPVHYPLNYEDSINYKNTHTPSFLQNIAPKNAYLLFIKVTAYNSQRMPRKPHSGRFYLMLFDTNKNQMVYGDYIKVNCDTRNREALFKVIDHAFRELILFRFSEKED